MPTHPWRRPRRGLHRSRVLWHLHASGLGQRGPGKKEMRYT